MGANTNFMPSKCHQNYIKICGNRLLCLRVQDRAEEYVPILWELYIITKDIMYLDYFAVNTYLVGTVIGY